MYVNYDNSGINPHYHYAYMRGDGNETFLIVCNFGSSDADISVKVPRAAFDYLHLRPGRYNANEALCGEKAVLDMQPDCLVCVHVPAHGATLWRMNV